MDVVTENKEKYSSFTTKVYVHDYVNKNGKNISK